MEEMNIKEGDFLFKVAYGLTKKDDIPSRVNGCRLFWRIVFMLIIAWPILLICIAFVVAFVLGFTFIFGFFVAKRPAVLSKEEVSQADLLMTPYKHWPTVKGKRIYPIWLVVAAVAVYYSPSIVSVLVDVSSATAASVSINFWWLITRIGGAFIGIVLACVIVYTIGAIRKSEWLKLTKELISAKKQKICPVVNIIRSS